MKGRGLVSVASFIFCLGLLSPTFAAPDPRDSVIVESKTVYPSNGPGAAYVRIYITNKDSLGGYTFPFLERSATGGAYATLGYPRTFGTGAAVRPLTTTLQGYKFFIDHYEIYSGYQSYIYNGTSPDTLIVTGFYDGNEETAEPPNLTRKALLEFKFDTVRTAFGTIEIDSAYRYPNMRLELVSRWGQSIKPNFVKGTITVVSEPGGCDVNGDGKFSLYDVVSVMNCAF